MSPHTPEPEDPDDLFAHTRMSLGEHIEELRTALVKAIKGFLVALVLGFLLAQPATQFIASPVERELGKFYKARLDRKLKELAVQKDSGEGPIHNLDKAQPMEQTFNRRQLAAAVGLNPNQFDADEMVTLASKVHPKDIAPLLDETIRDFIRPPTLSALSITEAFMVWLKVAIYIGIVFASPWIFWQIWMFVAAGLYPQEKKLVNFYLPVSLGLFLVGVLVCEFIVLPIGIRYLLSFNAWMNIEPDLRLSEWLTFAIMMPLVFGISFQLPLVMFFLDRVGILTVETYLKHWRMSVFVIAVLSALLSVSPDPFTMLAMAIPMWALYFLGIWLCVLVPRPEDDLEVPDPEEMVEV